MDERQQILAWFKNYGLKINDDQLNSLLTHVDLVRVYSSQLNLISKRDVTNLIERHVLDSLYALTVHNIPHNARAADIGSGAGFPGIPIAIIRPDIQMYLIESRRKRSLFLAKVINTIGLANAIVINDRWENLNLVYDIILTRAVFREAEIRNLLDSRLAQGGCILYYAKHNNIKVLKEK